MEETGSHGGKPAPHDRGGARVTGGGKLADTTTSPLPATQKAGGARLPVGAWISFLFAAGAVALAVMYYAGLLPIHPRSAGGPRPSAEASGASARHIPMAGAQTESRIAELDNAAFVAGLKIGGALGGSKMQVMIDGTLYATGDVVDAARGLLVMKIDDTTRRVTFIDTAGKTYVRALD